MVGMDTDSTFDHRDFYRSRFRRMDFYHGHRKGRTDMKDDSRMMMAAYSLVRIPKSNNPAEMES